MDMISSDFVLTKNQLEIFRAICLGNSTMKEIAGYSGQSMNTVYRMTSRLELIGVIVISKGRGARCSPSHGLHSAALKRYLLSNERPIDLIVGSKLLVLLSISLMPKSAQSIARETCLKLETVRVLAWSLKNAGVLRQNGSLIGISTTDVFMKQFLQDFSKGANLQIMDERTNVGIMIWNGGLEFLFSARSLSDPKNVRKTATSEMARYGIRFISENIYYYYSNWNLELRPEDIALHNILADQFNSRMIGYSILLLTKTGFDTDYLLEGSRNIGMEGVVTDIVSYMEGRPVTNRFVPDPEEMHELMFQYGVN